MLNGPAWLPVYAQMPLTAVSGHGSWITDDHGDEWLDAYGGHAVASTGHCHPHVVQAIRDQAATLVFYSTAVPHRLREELAEMLAERSPGDLSKVFFCNSGAEANENALGLARKATGRQKIVSVGGGWHGRTVACLAVTDGAKYEAGAVRAGMPLSVKVPFNDEAAMEAAVDATVAAVIVEPVQGLTGARDCSAGFLQAARRACDKAGEVGTAKATTSAPKDDKTQEIVTSPTAPKQTPAAPGKELPGGEVLFGSQTVGFGIDKDVIRVGSEIGKFDRIRLRVFERGTGETLACGTGACAAVAVGRRHGRLDERVAVHVAGGELTIEWPGPGRNIWLTGPAEVSFTGSVEIDT